ncbi:hypothetical protein SmJEL517_g03363 [Synchytrium microbalum]|uniref:Glucose-methanol-choline oxidoreductase N-terminal domain-containing protein n=1 Tax=Synchytrium microbalum TaxID=1806994 RepID=A0A507C8R8_9FUNG|nr:uncharacterized protein SmJEL517_g03363 [Synchytrium microbalum]TPX33923.1 hypothetical protein SmJEL517_g03363 [Synchytrium microbalum]
MEVIKRHPKAIALGALAVYLLARYQVFPFSLLSASKRKESREIPEEFDYVVVGGGSSGAALAARLAEDPNATVCLLEAGADHANMMKVNVPGLNLACWEGDIDWTFFTTKQVNQRSRISFWPRGKVLGGCSSINAMIWVRASNEDWDEYERDLGLTGWSWKHMDTVYKRMEGYTIPKDQLEDGHGFSGPMKITRTGNGKLIPVSSDFLKACAERGVGQNKLGTCGWPEGQPKDALQFSKYGADYNSEKQFGAGIVHTNIYNGQRWTTGKAYIHPIIDENLPTYRPNFYLLSSQQVTRVILEPSTHKSYKAVGVAYAESPMSPEKTIRARREVILSAGAVGSPHLLNLSGIGDKKELESVGIECLVDLPGVGKRLQDHLFAPVVYHCKKGHIGRNLFFVLNTLWDYVMNKSGFFTSSGMQVTGFFSSEKYLERVEKTLPHSFRSRPPPPNLQLHFAPASGAPFFQATARFDTLTFGPILPLTNGEVFDEQAHRVKSISTNKKLLVANAVSVFPTLLKPASLGTVTIKSKSPWDAPEIDPKYFSNEQDLEDMADGMIEARRIMKIMQKSDSKTSKIGAEVIDESIVDEVQRVTKLDREGAIASREYVKEYLRRNAITVYHPTSTCSMAVESDPLGVVDNHCRVRNVLGLRVVDASILPRISAGNTNAPAIAVGERAAEIIRAEYGRK